jgi:hypothetical protein
MENPGLLLEGVTSAGSKKQNSTEKRSLNRSNGHFAGGSQHRIAGGNRFSTT